MSDCVNGGRSVYQRPEGVAKGIHGRIVWDDGAESLLSFTRKLNGRERKALWVELDGRRYVMDRERDWDSEDE